MRKKVCTKCEEEKGLDEFYLNSNSADGHNWACKECNSNNSLKNREINKAKNKIIADNIFDKICSSCKITKYNLDFFIERQSPDGFNHDCKECIAEKGKITREKVKKENKNRTVYQENKLCSQCKLILPSSSFHKRSDTPCGLASACSDCAYITSHSKRVLKSNSELNVGNDEKVNSAFIRELKIAYNQCCAYCDDKPNRLTIDHIIPLSKGGKHMKSNLLPACAPCNFTKATRLPEKWCKQIGKSLKEITRKQRQLIASL